MIQPARILGQGEGEGGVKLDKISKVKQQT